MTSYAWLESGCFLLPLMLYSLPGVYLSGTFFKRAKNLIRWIKLAFLPTQRTNSSKSKKNTSIVCIYSFMYYFSVSVLLHFFHMCAWLTSVVPKSFSGHFSIFCKDWVHLYRHWLNRAFILKGLPQSSDSRKFLFPHLSMFWHGANVQSYLCGFLRETLLLFSEIDGILLCLTDT